MQANNVQERTAASRWRLRRLAIPRLPLSTGRYAHWGSGGSVPSTGVVVSTARPAAGSRPRYPLRPYSTPEATVTQRITRPPVVTGAPGVPGGSECFGCQGARRGTGATRACPKPGRRSRVHGAVSERRPGARSSAAAPREHNKRLRPTGRWAGRRTPRLVDHREGRRGVRRLYLMARGRTVGVMLTGAVADLSSAVALLFLRHDRRRGRGRVIRYGHTAHRKQPSPSG